MIFNKSCAAHSEGFRLLELFGDFRLSQAFSERFDTYGDFRHVQPTTEVRRIGGVQAILSQAILWYGTTEATSLRHCLRELASFFR